MEKGKFKDGIYSNSQKRQHRGINLFAIAVLHLINAPQCACFEKQRVDITIMQQMFNFHGPTPDEGCF